MKKNYILIIFIFGVLFMHKVQAQKVSPIGYYPMLNWDTSPYKSFRYTRPNSTSDWLNFRLLFPENYDSLAENGKKYPLVIMLHGAGESGKMEWDNSTRTNSPYAADDPRLDNNDHQLLFGGREHLQAVRNGRFPGFVMFPQNFYGTWFNGNGEATSTMRPEMAKMLELVDYLITQLKVDPDRIYIHGLSNGAGGAWYAAFKRPDLFAAALPMSHKGDPAMAERLAEVPLWVFQGANDTNPRPVFTEETIAAVRNAGGTVRYTKYENTGHNTWGRAYSEPDFFEWMLAQKKNDAINQPPQVEAGPDVTIMMPQDSVTLQASAVDPDGSVDHFLWEKLSGPEVSMVNNKSYILNLFGLLEGEYVFRVTATDDKGAMASDLVNLTVLADISRNNPPVVSAGPDKSITLPTDTLSFKATATDEDGSIVAYLWEKMSGPAVTMAGNSTSTLRLSALVEGTYVFRISVTDNKGAIASDQVALTVVAEKPENQVPIANAGADKTLTLPTNSINLSGRAWDADGRFVAFRWEKVSGPTVTMEGQNTANVKLTDLVEGVYVFRFSATDNGGATGSDEMIIIVIDPNTPKNKVPLVNAGSDKTIKLPVDSASFTALAYDEDGEVVSFYWEKVSGPAVMISGGSTATLSLSGLVEGSYVFRVKVTDNEGAEATDEVKLNVQIPSPENQVPVANAGADKTLTLPTNSINLSGRAWDADGRFVAFRWEKVSGPTVTMEGQNTANVKLTDLVEGVYVFRFSATDNGGATGSDEMTITVINPDAPKNQLPIVDAGADKTLRLPTTSTTLTASASDNDGQVVAYVWEKTSGPAASMSGESTQTLHLSGLVEGSYTFRVTVTDDKGATASDQVNLYVKASEPENQVPTASAGADKTLTLPTNSINLSGLAWDADGRFVAFRWEKVSGPSVTMEGQNTANVKLTDLVEGVYVFRFSATDNGGATGSDEMTLTVKAGATVAAVETTAVVAKTSFSVYPNTFENEVNLEISSGEGELFEVSVYSFLGKLIHAGQVLTDGSGVNIYSIDLSESQLPSGVYLLQVLNKKTGKKEVIRIMKR